MGMAFYDDYLAGIDNLEHRQKFAQVLKWVEAHYPNLEGRIAWKQPMWSATEKLDKVK